MSDDRTDTEVNVAQAERTLEELGEEYMRADIDAKERPLDNVSAAEVEVAVDAASSGKLEERKPLTEGDTSEMETRNAEQLAQAGEDNSELDAGFKALLAKEGNPAQAVHEGEQEAAELEQDGASVPERQQSDQLHL